MEIIKKGIKPSEKSAEFSCRTCKSVLKAKMSEGNYQSDQRDGDYVVFSCPVCLDKPVVSVKAFK